MPERPNDSPPEASKALPLAQAFLVHAEPKLVEQYHRATERLNREGHWEYVGNPKRPDYYVLSEFDGNGRALLEEKRELLNRINVGFLDRLRSGELIAWARENSPLAPWREIPASAWSTLRLKDVEKGTVTGPGVKLFDVQIGPRVMETPPTPVAAPPLPETGAPGRPSHMHMIEAEFEHRNQTAQIENSLAREAAALAAWFKTHHPDKQPVTAKTISNRLRSRFREAVGKKE